MACSAAATETPRTLCGGCYAEGKRFCAYCGGTFRLRVASLACGEGHFHRWCDRCAAAWDGTCPESDEARVAKAVMA